MGPLVPEIISEEISLIIAFILGIGFGFALEQAGFSSTRKLVGLFYGYDFTVLKVFFTAGVTAMTGVLVLSHFGLLDMNLIYVNPTFLWSALIGGVIMGAGFIIGGFCPGTSLCAAAVGKVDAMVFIGGSLIGILAFMEGFPLFKDLYTAENWGEITIYNVLNISKESFAFILVAVAVSAFFVTAKIEDYINNQHPGISGKRIVQYTCIAISPFVLVFLVASTPSENQRILNQVDKKLNMQEVNIKSYEVDKLAFELINNRHQLNLINVGSVEQFNKFNIPTSINIPYDSLLNRDYRRYFKQSYKTNIIYAEDIKTAQKAYLLATELGNAETFILNEKASKFKVLIFEPKIPAPPATKAALDTYNFRVAARKKLLEIQEALKNVKPIEKKVNKIKGGCS